MPRISDLEYEKIDQQLQEMDTSNVIKADPNVDLSEVELVSNLMIDKSEYVIKTIESSLGDSLIDDLKKEARNEAASQTHDILVDLLDGPASSVQDAITQTASQVLSQNPEIATELTQPEYSQIICDAITAAF